MMIEAKSKTQKKREAESLQKLGQQLSKLNLEQLAKMPLPDRLMQALFEEKTIKSHGAKRRHLQLIGQIMCDIDIEETQAIQDAYENIVKGQTANAQQFHLAEQWRMRLMSEGNSALTEFIQEYHCDDLQNLRHLIRQAIHERDEKKNHGSARTLFQLIMKYLDNY
jgi:ribosome-associated protein